MMQTKFSKDKVRITPIVISAKRFEALRSWTIRNQEKQAAVEEEQQLQTYLKEGGEALCKTFTNFDQHTEEEAKQAKLEQLLRADEILRKQIQVNDDITRKQRIIRAKLILNNLKQGQMDLRQALVTSDVIYQTKFNEQLNKEILEDARRQQELDEAQCPEALVPFSNLTEEQLQAQEQEKATVIKVELAKDLEERRQRRLADKQQQLKDGILEREQCACLYEIEKREAQKRKLDKRNWCRQAYRDALEEKAKVNKFNNICEQIEDRVKCVDITKRRNLDVRSSKEIKALKQKVILQREARGMKVFHEQQAAERKDRDLQQEIVNRHQQEEVKDEADRQGRIADLAKQRCAYQLEEQQQAEEQRQRLAEIRRFDIATRCKNKECFETFENLEKERNDKATVERRKYLYGQRDEFVGKRNTELLERAACIPDPHLQDDVRFFKAAVKTIEEAQNTGRPLYPIAKCVQTYRDRNNLSSLPPAQVFNRNSARDRCWPGFHTKADLVYTKYEQREQCRREQIEKREGILSNCLKITQLAAQENPLQPCIQGKPIKCFEHRGIVEGQPEKSQGNPKGSETCIENSHE